MKYERHILLMLAPLLEETRQVILREGRDGLRPSQFRVIDSVPDAHGITITELAERVGMTKQGIGQFVTQLTEDGFLETEVDPNDRRVRLVVRTRQGRDAAQRLTRVLQRVEEDWTERVGARRYEVFRSVLNDLAHAD